MKAKKQSLESLGVTSQFYRSQCQPPLALLLLRSPSARMSGMIVEEKLLETPGKSSNIQAIGFKIKKKKIQRGNEINLKQKRQ